MCRQHSYVCLRHAKPLGHLRAVRRIGSWRLVAMPVRANRHAGLLSAENQEYWDDHSETICPQNWTNWADATHVKSPLDPEWCRSGSDSRRSVGMVIGPKAWRIPTTSCFSPVVNANKTPHHPRLRRTPTPSHSYRTLYTQFPPYSTFNMHRTYSMRQSRAPTASQIQNPPPPTSSTKGGRFFGKSNLGT